MDQARIILGLLAIFLAYMLIFRRNVIFRVNAWIRSNIFSDQLLLFSGRRIAILMFLLGVIALFSGIEQITQDDSLRPRVRAKLLDRANKSFVQKDFESTIQQCREITRTNPQNLIALELWAAALWALERKEEAQEKVGEILAIDPTYPINRGPIRKVLEHRKGDKIK